MAQAGQFFSLDNSLTIPAFTRMGSLGFCRCLSRCQSPRKLCRSDNRTSSKEKESTVTVFGKALCSAPGKVGTVPK